MNTFKKKWKRVVLFAHFDLENEVDDYVIHYLKNLSQISSYIIFISTSTLTHESFKKVNELCDDIILRKNVGYDFLSWRVGFEKIPNINLFDELIICNDSVYGPLFPLEDMFIKMSNSGYDFWGITDSYDINYHLHSYFLGFKKKVFLSSAFIGFIENIQVEKNKNEIIRKYEIGLTQNLIANGYSAGAFIPLKKGIIDLILSLLSNLNVREIFNKTKKLISKETYSKSKWDSKKLNCTHYFWRELISKYKIPFLKVELIRDNPCNINITNYQKVIRKHTNYNISLIENHQNRIKNLQKL